MIKCNLATLLAERGLKITKVAKDTGISRTTLTALAGNTGQGIQFDTIDKLCQYLKIEVNSFFVFHPSTITVNDLRSDTRTVTVPLEILYKNQYHYVHLEVIVKYVHSNTVQIYISPSLDTAYTDDNDWFGGYYDELPILFKTEFEQELMDKIVKHLEIKEDSEKFLYFESHF